MEMIADALLIAGAASAALYCRILAQRLAALKSTDSGVGAAIAALARQVDEMQSSLKAAKSVSGDQTKALSQLVARGEMAAGRLELLLAALHENGRKRPLAAKTAANDDGAGLRAEAAAAVAASPAAAPSPAALSPAAPSPVAAALAAAERVAPAALAPTALSAVSGGGSHWGSAP